MKRLKKILLGEIDLTLTRSHHQTLAEIMNDLYVRGTISNADLSDDSIIRALSGLHLLDLSDSVNLSDLRHALTRLATGEYGICMTCRRNIPIRDLNRQPTAVTCATCRTFPPIPHLKKHEKPRSHRHSTH